MPRVAPHWTASLSSSQPFRLSRLTLSRSALWTGRVDGLRRARREQPRPRRRGGAPGPPVFSESRQPSSPFGSAAARPARPCAPTTCVRPCVPQPPACGRVCPNHLRAHDGLAVGTVPGLLLGRHAPTPQRPALGCHRVHQSGRQSDSEPQLSFSFRSAAAAARGCCPPVRRRNL